MTNEELNTALYEKMFAEQQRYREWLLSQPPDEILNHCYEFTVREDIVLALEYIETGVIPKYAGCVNGVNWFKDRGQWADTGKLYKCLR